MGGTTSMEAVIRSDVYITQSIDHSAITISNGYQCKYANFARTMANSAFSRTNVNECKEADSTHSTGQGASSNSNVNERKWADKLVYKCRCGCRWIRRIGIRGSGWADWAAMSIR